MIVCLIGDTNLRENFTSVAQMCALNNMIVLRPEVYPKADSRDEEISKGHEDVLAEITMEKITMADLIIVVGGSKSLSLSNVAYEVEYAQKLNKPVLTTLDAKFNYEFPNINNTSKKKE